MNFKKLKIVCSDIYESFLIKPLPIRIRLFFKIYYKAILSGLLLGFGFIPFPFLTLLFAMVPFWFFLYEQKRLKTVLIGGFLCQMFATWIGYHWLIFTFYKFGQMNLFFSFVSLLATSTVLNIYIPLSGMLWFVISYKLPYKLPLGAKLLCFPLIFSFLHEYIPTVFPWSMGYSWLWAGLWAAQTAELWGFRFFNSLVYIFNFFLLIFFKHRFDPLGKKALGASFALFLFLNGLGLYLKGSLPKPDRLLNAILIQNNIGTTDPVLGKLPPQKAFQRSKNLSYKAILKYARLAKDREKTNFILWSEGSYPYPVRENQEREQRLSRLVKKTNIPLITGGLSQSEKGYSISLFATDRKGKFLKPVYNKVKLLVFGEYFPGLNTFPVLKKIFPYLENVNSMIAGKAPQVQELEGINYGWQICYEALFDRFSRSLAQNKAQVLVNITNDFWYDLRQQPWQHLTSAFARAIEVRRPLIRATNTGRSGVIFADGTLDLKKISPMNKAWSQRYKVPYYTNPPKTLFMSWGYYINEIFWVFLLLLILFFCFKKALNGKTNL